MITTTAQAASMARVRTSHSGKRCLQEERADRWCGRSSARAQGGHGDHRRGGDEQDEDERRRGAAGGPLHLGRAVARVGDGPQGRSGARGGGRLRLRRGRERRTECRARPGRRRRLGRRWGGAGLGRRDGPHGRRGLRRRRRGRRRRWRGRWWRRRGRRRGRGGCGGRRGGGCGRRWWGRRRAGRDVPVDVARDRHRLRAARPRRGVRAGVRRRLAGCAGERPEQRDHGQYARRGTGLGRYECLHDEDHESSGAVPRTRARGMPRRS